MNADERLLQVLHNCHPSKALSFHSTVDRGVVRFSVEFVNYANENTIAEGQLAFYDDAIHPLFPSSFKPVNVHRDDAPALLSRMIDRFVSGSDARSLAQSHNRKVQS